MKRKEKSKRKKGKSHISSPLSSNDEKSVADLLERIEIDPPPDLIARITSPIIAQTVIERMPLEGEVTVSFLQLLHDKFSDKIVQKAVKRAFFRLQRKGFSVDQTGSTVSESGPVFKPIEKEPPGVFIGPIADGFGFRAVFITLNRTNKGQDLAVGMISDEKGVQEFLFGNFNRKKVREIKAEIEENAGPLVATTLSHVATLLETAYECHHKGDPLGAVSADFIEFRSIFRNELFGSDTKDLINYLPQLSESEKIMTQSGLVELFEKATMKNWIIDFETLKPYLEDIVEANDSPLVLAETQKQDRLREIKTKAMKDIFPPKRLALLRKRLEEMSYFFLKSGDDKGSRLARAASGTIQDDVSIFEQNPVPEFIIESSFSFYTEGRNQEAQEESFKEGQIL